MASLLEDVAIGLPHQRAESVDAADRVDYLFERWCLTCGLPTGPRTGAQLKLVDRVRRTPIVCLVHIGGAGDVWARRPSAGFLPGYETLLVREDLAARLVAETPAFEQNLRPTVRGDQLEVIGPPLPCVGADVDSHSLVATRRCRDCRQLMRMPEQYMDISVRRSSAVGQWFVAGAPNRLGVFGRRKSPTDLWKRSGQCDTARFVSDDEAFDLAEVVPEFQFVPFRT